MKKTNDQVDTINSLLDEIKKGVPDSRNNFFTFCYPIVLKMVQNRLDKRLGARVSPEDITQDVFIIVDKKLNEFMNKDNFSFKGWTKKIVNDVIMDSYRKNTAKKRDFNRETEVVDVSARHDSPEDSLLYEELVSEMWTAAVDLPPKYYQILVMRVIDKMSNSEVAKALNISEPSSGMRYLRATEALKMKVLGA